MLNAGRSQIFAEQATCGDTLVMCLYRRGVLFRPLTSARRRPGRVGHLAQMTGDHTYRASRGVFLTGVRDRQPQSDLDD